MFGWRKTFEAARFRDFLSGPLKSIRQKRLPSLQAYNDGRYLESEIKLSENGQGIRWGFRLGEIKTSSLLRINAEG